jgi:ATP-dependent DNA helicase DinG
MLANLKETETPADFCDWFGLERLDGRDLDVGMYRHWIDPTRPFAETLLAQAQGVLVTSATLTDRGGEAAPDETAGRDGGAEDEADWRAAEELCGASRLAKPAICARFPSPFDYAANTRVLVVQDVARESLAQVAAAYRALFMAAGGGALGLFTAINRLRAVHREIGPALEDAGLPLLAQHVDAMDTATLVDIFRAEEDACLLGTDAVRDGVDVPGPALRLIVFDRVPWPRPDLRHKARRAAFGGRAYDERLTRLKLKQAFGRLVRRADDRGIFVSLDARLPSRLFTAFPPEVTPHRLGLAEAVALTKAFFEKT